MASSNSTALPLSAFDYVLPPERIAQVPIEPRDASRMMVLDRAAGTIHHSAIKELPRWLSSGDLIVANNTRVFAARLRGRKRNTGGAVELLLLRQISGDCWRALAKPVRRLKTGTVIVVESLSGGMEELSLEVVAIEDAGEIVIKATGLTAEQLEAYGSTPLPPYITEPLEDNARYQTLHASVIGSAAAPTAGLHVTPDLRRQLVESGVGWTEVTLHVGLDTFRPVMVEDMTDHHIHQEWFNVPPETVRRIDDVQGRGGRIVALGTTSARTLETLGQIGISAVDARNQGLHGLTELFIRPGHVWTVVDALLTNFHLPRSTLLAMVSALAGREAVLSAYHEAIAAEYRFFSFGDAMLIV